MDAKTYLDTVGVVAATKLANEAGSNYAYFSQIAYGHRRPSPRLAKKLTRLEPRLTLHELRPDIYGELAHSPRRKAA